MNFDSPDGFQTFMWGPALWHFLHIMSFNYPVHPSERDKENYYNFLISLRNVLPCKYCRNNFFDNLRQTDFREAVFENRDSFSRFVHRLHDNVNRMLGKSCDQSFEQVRLAYEHFRAGGCSKETMESAAKEKGCTRQKYPKTSSKCLMLVVPRNTSHLQEKWTAMGRSMYVHPGCEALRMNTATELHNRGVAETKDAGEPSAHTHSNDQGSNVNGKLLFRRGIKGGFTHFV